MVVNTQIAQMSKLVVDTGLRLCYSGIMLLRVDGGRMTALMRERKVTATELAEVVGVHRISVSNFKDETYPLLSQAAALLGVHPLALVKEQDGELSVDADKMRAYMEEAGYNARSLAAELQVHYNTVFNLFKFDFARPNKYATALGVSPLALLTVA